MFRFLAFECKKSFAGDFPTENYSHTNLKRSQEEEAEKTFNGFCPIAFQRS